MPLLQIKKTLIFLDDSQNVIRERATTKTFPGNKSLNPVLVMSNIGYLTNKFDTLRKIYEKEKDPELKALCLKQMLEIAYKVGEIAYHDQITED